jgi:hypothetical protein
VTVLPIPFARRAAATACAAVQPTSPLFGRWRPAGLSLAGILKLQGLLVFAWVHMAWSFFVTPLPPRWLTFPTTACPPEWTAHT